MSSAIRFRSKVRRPWLAGLITVALVALSLSLAFYITPETKRKRRPMGETVWLYRAGLVICALIFAHSGSAIVRNARKDWLFEISDEAITYCSDYCPIPFKWETVRYVRAVVSTKKYSTVEDGTALVMHVEIELDRGWVPNLGTHNINGSGINCRDFKKLVLEKLGGRTGTEVVVVNRFF